MRNAYKACEPFLTTLIKPLEESNVVKAKIEALKSIKASLE
jgi:hypothetical protein